MAYYDNAPSHKPQGKKSFGREKWVEEGSEYRGAPFHKIFFVAHNSNTGCKY